MQTDEKKQGRSSAGENAHPEWFVGRVREVLIAMGRISECDISDIDPDDLREIVNNVRHNQRLRDPDFGMSRQDMRPW